jgi:hypothetical protein
MSYSNSASDRIDELRFRSQQQSSRNDSPLLGLVSPPRNGTRLPPTHSHDGRTSLPRRFTTDLGRIPTLSSIANQRGSEVQDFTSSVSRAFVDLHNHFTNTNSCPSTSSPYSLDPFCYCSYSLQEISGLLTIVLIADISQS